ncbi:hypothetical protein ACHRV5_11885 [Flavobacterium sp. FlaQc-52]|jgi:hypothetical protein|uniref:hypothetical protein n=1 Tax=Flavobacterium sp. FlaQc-52 TaxID=3374185 RepID=UPI003757CB0D
MTAISGGKFWSGFAAGALSSIASSLYQGGTNTSTVGGKTVGIANTVFNSIGDNLGDLGTIAFGTVAGGVGAALTGGNFWQGAVTGLVVSGLNHTLHKMKENKSFRKQLEAKGIKPDGKFGFTNEEFIDNINAVDELYSLFRQAARKLGELVVATNVYNKNGGEASGGTNMTSNGKYEISLSTTRIKTNLDFVYTYGADLSHVVYNCDMNFQTWSNRSALEIKQEEYSVHYSWNYIYDAPDGHGQVNYWGKQLNK